MSRRAHTRRSTAANCAQPAFLTGTSAEYLGRRALPRIVRDRPTIFLLGPTGAGKTSVALRLAQPRPDYLDRIALEAALVDRVRSRVWPERCRLAPVLVLDGPVWLQSRPAIVRVLGELLRERNSKGLKTLVCQPDHDGSVNLLMDQVEPGSTVVLGLRFPKGRRGRLRFATRQCERMGLPKTAARGTETIEPWGYAQVKAYLDDWRRTHGDDAPEDCK